MPERPASKKQLRFVHWKAGKGAKWAKKTVREWHGKTFDNLPVRKRKKKDDGSRVVRA